MHDSSSSGNSHPWGQGLALIVLGPPQMHAIGDTLLASPPIRSGEKSHWASRSAQAKSEQMSDSRRLNEVCILQFRSEIETKATFGLIAITFLFEPNFKSD